MNRLIKCLCKILNNIGYICEISIESYEILASCDHGFRIKQTGARFFHGWLPARSIWATDSNVKGE